MALPVRDIVAQDCVLFLWAVNPMLPHALNLGARWGFVFKTVAFVWAKTRGDPPTYPIGNGYWTRANPEVCLLFTRGRPKRVARDVRTLVIAPRREHSRKPDEVYDGIRRLSDGPRLEMFARELRPGFTAWGNETEKFAPRMAAE